MKVQHRFFQDLAKKKYLSYIHSLPQFRKEQTEAYLMVILIIFTVSFFGIFAIMPALSTIAQLKKDLEDSTFLNEQLKTKITNMASLQEQYNLLAPNLPVLLSAIPQDAQAPLLLGQIQQLAKQEGVTLSKLEVQELPETTAKTKDELKDYALIIDVAGNFENIQSFYEHTIHFQRIVTFESMTLTKNKETGLLLLSIKAKAYFKP